MGPKTPPTVWLTALVVAAVQVGGSFGATDNQPERRALDALAVALALVGPAALLMRRRAPLAAVAASMAAALAFVGRGHPYGPIFLSVVVALFSAVVAGRRVATWILAGAGGTAFIVVEASVDPRAGDLSWVHWGLVAGWLLVILALAELVRARNQQAAEQARAAEEARRRREGEQRLRIAQDLHDVLAHDISLVNVQASVALHLLDEQPEQARPALSAIKAASHDALQELRAALDALRGGEEAPRAPSPTLADLDTLATGVRSSGLDVEVDSTEPTRRLPDAVEVAAYRIVQEALTNVTRHARATSVTIRVRYDDGLAVEVTDDGVGGDVHEGNGIRGMRERAAALGGTVAAGPRRGGGFRVAARVPPASAS